MSQPSTRCVRLCCEAAARQRPLDKRTDPASLSCNDWSQVAQRLFARSFRGLSGRLLFRLSSRGANPLAAAADHELCTTTCRN